MSMGPYGKGIRFRDWQRAEWDRLITRHPEVLDGSSGQHMAWELADPERWVPHGYAVVRVDSRGAGRSPGYLDCLSPQETADFCQAIEWAAAQPWSTGKVGLCGVSYYAMTQWLAAARQPPHLAAIVVWEGAQDFYRDVTHHGGIFSSVFPRLWYERRVVGNQHGQGARGLADRGAGGLAAGPETLPEDALQARRADLPATAREHHLDDAFHQSRTADLSRVTVPAAVGRQLGRLRPARPRQLHRIHRRRLRAEVAAGARRASRMVLPAAKHDAATAVLRLLPQGPG